ncbi:MAG: SDR family NAD(P)-dependent oxidoreductase [Alphaproteobacteria bacterium]|nr:SDR family NAD(P)-dependent oxidoreductase [Alphaproteobacteria bacterium]
MSDLYRAQPEDGLAWVTGASSGIGRGTALELTRRGFRVLATARSKEALDTLVSEASSLKGSIIARTVDVTDAALQKQVVDEVEASEGPIVLAFLNAGIYWPMRAHPFDAASFKKIFDVNVGGVVNGLEVIFDRMAARGRGQIAINASVAGYIGLPRAAAYSSSKAALIVMAESLKIETDALGITLQIVNPGFVKTPLTDKNDHPMPFLMELVDASRVICNGFARGGFEITFPWQLSRILKFLRLLPYEAYFSLIRKSTGYPPKR